MKSLIIQIFHLIIPIQVWTLTFSKNPKKAIVISNSEKYYSHRSFPTYISPKKKWKPLAKSLQPRSNILTDNFNGHGNLSRINFLLDLFHQSSFHPTKIDQIRNEDFQKSGSFPHFPNQGFSKFRLKVQGFTLKRLNYTLQNNLKNIIQQSRMKLHSKVQVLNYYLIWKKPSFLICNIFQF